MQRCTNPNAPGYCDYGARGIKFNFPSVLDGCLWVIENLGLPEKIGSWLQLDRIKNDLHYEAGNLKWSTRSVNLSHTRRRMNHARMHAFRLKYPDVVYADGTLKNLFMMELTDKQIVERFYTPSDKPKGKFGTCSTPDLEIASLHKDC